MDWIFKKKKKKKKKKGLWKGLNKIIKRNLKALKRLTEGSDKAHLVYEDTDSMLTHAEKLKELEIREKENESKAKLELTRIVVDGVCRITGFVIGAAVPVLAIMADKKGWFVDKFAANLSGKPKYF